MRFSKDITAVRRTNGHWAGVFHDTIYRVRVHVIWDVDSEQINKYCKNTIDGETDSTIDGADALTIVFSDDNGLEVLMAFAGTKKTVNFYDTLAHECFHAASFILDSRGLKLTAESNEAYAYLIGSLVSRSLELINKSRRKRRAP